ncbi:hypothetical protein PACILC2_21380 [Paenibacillus cisolokensis]|uniref:ABC transporter substrate-binding protein n=1 Tax=Paenibacillus cisolokensis TaxID=1658519 RepID=A0ABQ4N5T9_9BACL|nr:hypothetical protein [Paenibacillus cisolokensis]GIQ63570.1 hypothetical protein PACILC2_21380 [Paenibacillus cisolokensis]
MFKRVRAIMIVMSALLLLLSACGSNADSNAGADASSNAGGEGEKVVIQWWDSMTSEATQGALQN